MLLQSRHELKAVHLGHHEIENDDVGCRLLQTFKRRQAVSGFN